MKVWTMKPDLSEINSFKRHMSDKDKAYALGNNGYIITLARNNFLVTSQKKLKNENEVVTSYEVKNLNKPQDKMFIEHHYLPNGQIKVQTKIGSTPINDSNGFVKYAFLRIDPCYEIYTSEVSETRNNIRQYVKRSDNKIIHEFLSAKG